MTKTISVSVLVAAMLMTAGNSQAQERVLLGSTPYAGQTLQERLELPLGLETEEPFVAIVPDEATLETLPIIRDEAALRATLRAFGQNPNAYLVGQFITAAICIGGSAVETLIGVFRGECIYDGQTFSENAIYVLPSGQRQRCRDGEWQDTEDTAETD